MIIDVENITKSGKKQIQKVKINPDEVWIMNCRDLTIDYRTYPRNTRFKLTKKSFDGLIALYDAEKEAARIEKAEKEAEKLKQSEDQIDVKPENVDSVIAVRDDTESHD